MTPNLSGLQQQAFISYFQIRGMAGLCWAQLDLAPGCGLDSAVFLTFLDLGTRSCSGHVLLMMNGKSTRGVSGNLQCLLRSWPGTSTLPSVPIPLVRASHTARSNVNRQSSTSPTVTTRGREGKTEQTVPWAIGQHVQGQRVSKAHGQCVWEQGDGERGWQVESLEKEAGTG